MSGIVSSEAHKPATERRTGQGRGLLIVFIAAMTVAAPLLLPMTAYYLKLVNAGLYVCGRRTRVDYVLG